jgi:hypothetical protein
VDPAAFHAERLRLEQFFVVIGSRVDTDNLCPRATAGFNADAAGIYAAPGIHAAAGIYTASGIHEAPGIYAASGIHEAPGIYTASGNYAPSGTHAAPGIDAAASYGSVRSHHDAVGRRIVRVIEKGLRSLFLSLPGLDR